MEYKNVPGQSERSLKLSNKNRLGESKTSIWDQNIDLSPNTSFFFEESYEISKFYLIEDDPSVILPLALRFEPVLILTLTTQLRPKFFTQKVWKAGRVSPLFWGVQTRNLYRWKDKLFVYRRQ